MAQKTGGSFLTWGSVREIVTLLLIVFLIRTFGFGLYQVPTGSMETTMLVGERFFADKFTILFSSPERGDIISFNDPTYEYSKSRLMRLFQHYIWGPANWTKRIIGIPGDTIKGVIENGKPVIYLNDKKLDEPYINKYSLIGVWKIDPLTFVRSPHLLSDNNLGNLWSFKSYDAGRPYRDQPFYRIDPGRVVYVQQGEPLLRRPGTPLKEGTDVQRAVDKNYWDGSDEFNIRLGENQYWAMGDNRLGSKDCRFFGPIDGKLIHGKIFFRIWSLDSDESWWIVDLIKHPIDFWKRVRWNRFFQRVI